MFLIEKEEVRNDLILRKEVKYVCENADTNKMRILLETNFKRTIYKEPVSLVRSIYFDDCCLSSCKANLDGLGKRRKIRIRWYDKDRNAKNFFFEIKIRNNSLTGKRRLRVFSDKDILDMRYKEIAEEFEKKLPFNFMPLLLKYPEPILIVEYKREHFISPFDKTIRVTLDYDITFYDQTYAVKPKFQFGSSMDNIAILECKIPAEFQQKKVQSLLYPLILRPSRSSKYVYGCHYLNLVNSVY